MKLSSVLVIAAALFLPETSYAQQASAVGQYMCFMPSLTTGIGTEMVVSPIPSEGGSGTIYNDGTTRIEAGRLVTTAGLIPNGVFVDIRPNGSYRIFHVSRSASGNFEVANGRFGVNASAASASFSNLPANFRYNGMRAKSGQFQFLFNLLDKQGKVHTKMLCEKSGAAGTMSASGKATTAAVQTTPKIAQNPKLSFKPSNVSPLLA